MNDGNYTIGPGFWGFVAFFVMAIALWLLVRNMSGRLRRMAYQERERDGDLSDLKQTRSGDSTDRPAPTGALDLSSPDRGGDSPGVTWPHGQAEDSSATDSGATPPDDTLRDETT